MFRSIIASTVAAAAVVAVAAPAMGEAVVYDTRHVKSNPPDRPGHEHVSLDIPTGYAKIRTDWHTVSFVEKAGAGRTITVDLHPEADTVRKLRDERRALIRTAGDSYQEFAFRVNEPGSKVRARWVYTWQPEGTEDTEPYVSVLLMGGNRLQVVGKVSDKEHVDRIRSDVRRSLRFHR